MAQLHQVNGTIGQKEPDKRRNITAFLFHIRSRRAQAVKTAALMFERKVSFHPLHSPGRIALTEDYLCSLLANETLLCDAQMTRLDKFLNSTFG